MVLISEDIPLCFEDRRKNDWQGELWIQLIDGRFPQTQTYLHRNVGIRAAGQRNECGVFRLSCGDRLTIYGNLPKTHGVTGQLDLERASST